MTHGFLDQRNLSNSVLRRTDPRWKTILFFAAAVIVASEPRGELSAFGFYWTLLALLALLGRVDLLRWGRRCLVAAPFLFVAAALPIFAPNAELAPLDWSASILLRGFAVVGLLSLLAETTEFSEMVQALQQLWLPTVWVGTLVLAYRYVFVLIDEWSRVSDARACRAPSMSGSASAGVMAQQLGLVFVRAWERAERIHGAMMARGFDGTWPVLATANNTPWGGLLCVFVLSAFAIVRIYA